MEVKYLVLLTDGLYESVYLEVSKDNVREVTLSQILLKICFQILILVPCAISSILTDNIHKICAASLLFIGTSLFYCLISETLFLYVVRVSAPISKEIKKYKDHPEELFKIVQRMRKSLNN